MRNIPHPSGIRLTPSPRGRLTNLPDKQKCISLFPKKINAVALAAENGTITFIFSKINWDLSGRCRIYQRTESAEFVSLPLGEGGPLAVDEVN